MSARWRRRPRRFAVHALKAGRVGAGALEPDAVLCEDPRWLVSEANGDRVDCARCLVEIERARRAKVRPGQLAAPLQRRR